MQGPAVLRSGQTEIGGISEDGLFNLEQVRCIGACGLAPAITVDDEVHGNLTVTKVRRLAQKLRRAAEKEAKAAEQAEQAEAAEPAQEDAK